MITKQEALDLLQEKVITLEDGELIEFIFIEDIYEVIDKIFDKSTIKDSFNNNSNCTIEIG